MALDADRLGSFLMDAKGPSLVSVLGKLKISCSKKAVVMGFSYFGSRYVQVMVKKT